MSDRAARLVEAGPLRAEDYSRTNARPFPVVVVVVMIVVMAASVRPEEPGTMSPTAGARENDMVPKLMLCPGLVNTFI